MRSRGLERGPVRKRAAGGGEQQEAIKVAVWKKVFVRIELRGGSGGSRRKEQEAIEVEVWKKILVERWGSRRK